MTQIVGFAGKKQSGKNTACNFVVAMKLAELGICKASRMSDDGSRGFGIKYEFLTLKLSALGCVVINVASSNLSKLVILFLFLT